jgi:Spy/CpxP family protein refolding chaperone
MRLRTRIKSAGLILGLLMVFAAVAAAQQPVTQNPGPNTNTPGLRGSKASRGDRRGPGRREGFGPGMLRELNLTDDQKQQVRAIMKQSFAGNKDLRDELRNLGEKRQQGTLTPEEQARAKTLHEQMRASMKDTEAKIAGVLTPEQKTRVEQLQKERRSNQERFGRKHRGSPDQTNAPVQP